MKRNRNAASLTHKVATSYHTTARLRAPVKVFPQPFAAVDWYVAETKPHAEKAAYADLIKLGYAVYLPLAKRWHRRPRHQGGGREIREVVLLPRYLFVGLPKGERIFSPIRMNRHIHSILCDSFGFPQVIREREVDAMRNAEAIGDYDETLHHAQRMATLLGQEVTFAANHVLEGLLGTITAVSKSFVRINVAGATVPTIVKIPVAELDATMLVPQQDDQQKRSAP